MVLPDNFYEQKFLQYFMWKKVCCYYDVVKMYNDCLKNDDEEAGGSQRVQSESPELLTNISLALKGINAKIEPLQMKITKGYEERTGEAYYALISTNTSELPRFQSAYSKNELLYFQKLMSYIICSGESKIELITALNLVEELDYRTSKKELEDLINRFCTDMWLIEENGNLSLSTRSRLEFAPYLHSEFEKFLDICICKDFVLQYFVVCSDCERKMHRHCVARYFKEAKQKNCPSCQEPWTDDIED